MAASNSIWKLLIFYNMFFPSVQCISIPGTCLVGKWNYISSDILFSINNKPNYVWLDHGHGLLIFPLSTQFWLSATGHIWGFRAFLGECMEGMSWRLNSGHGLLISSFWCLSDLVEQVKFGISGHFPEKNALEILHADGSWPPTELIKLWSRYVDFLLASLSFSETGQIWGFWAFPGTCMKGMAWDFCMLMYPGYLQNWLDYCYVLLIFPI